MDDKVKSKSQMEYKYLFHFGLIKLLVLEELRKSNRDQNSFLLLENYDPEVMPTPSKKISSKVKPHITPTTSSKKRKQQTKDLGKEAGQTQDVVREKKTQKGKGL